MMWQQGFVLAVLLGIITCLITTRIKPSFIFAGGAFIAFLAGMIEIGDVATNFTNSSLLTLVLLILASSALEKTRLISWVSRSLSTGKLGAVVAKLGLSTAFLSSFTNNTAVVVSLIGAIKRNQAHAPSKLLIPLSYTAILGGTLTLIGTSTNLIINSFVEDAGLPSLGFFTPTMIGLSVLVGGLLVLIPLSYLLPSYEEHQQEELPYFLEAIVEPGSPLVGKSISENNLRALRKLFLAEVVVSSSASFCNNTLKSIHFRDRFDAVVVAIRRGHERLQGGLGSIELNAGDTLVLVPGKRFEQERKAHRKEFVLVNDLDSSARLDENKSSLVLLGFVGVIGAALLNVFPLIKGLSIFLLAAIFFGVIQMGELRRRFPVDIIVIVGSALTIAQLMMSSGLSATLGEMFIETFNGWGAFGALVATYLFTLILTELVTNNAAAALAFPLGYSMAIGYGVDPMPFIMAVLFGASASFISPYGYQTNLLVYSVGNYKLADYIRVGIPVSIVYSVLVLALIPQFFPF